MAKNITLPEGFELEDQGAGVQVPEGFELEQATDEPVEQAPVSPERPGLISNLNESLVKRGVNMAEELDTPSRGIWRDISAAPEKALRVTGQAAGLVGDVVGDVVGAAIPNRVKDYAKEKFSGIINSPQGAALLSPEISALTGGMKGYQAFSEAFPNAAKDVEAVANIASVVPLAKAPAAIGASVKEAGLVATDIAKAATRTAPAAIDKSLLKTITYKVEKAIRPSVSGKGTVGLNKAYYEKAADAVKRIVENKSALRLTDASGEIIEGALPKNLNQFAEAVEQTKKNIFKEYDNLARSAGASGADVKLTPIAVELDKIIQNKVTKDLNPELVDYALKRQEALWKRKTYSAEEAQDAIQSLNNSLQAYYRNPSYDTASKAGIDAIIVNNLRKSLDDVIEQTTGPGYQELKRSYGALKTIEKDVVHRSIVDARKNVKGLIDFSNMATASEFVGGVMSANPAMLGSAAAIQGTKWYLKRLNDPNRMVKNMFNEVGTLMEKRAKASAPFKPQSRTGQALISGMQGGQSIPGANVPQLPVSGLGIAAGLSEAESMGMGATQARTANNKPGFKWDSVAGALIPFWPSDAEAGQLDVYAARNRALADASYGGEEIPQTQVASAPVQEYQAKPQIRESEAGVQMFVDGDFDSKWLTLNPQESATIKQYGRLSQSQLANLKKRGGI